MPRRKVIQVIEGDWMPWRNYERWVCCDCSLVHRVEKRTREGQLEVRMFRENRSTGQYRRSEGIKISCKKK